MQSTRPSRIRDELLAQHDGVRTRLEAARRAAHGWVRGAAPASHLREELERLGVALRSHHLREEQALRELARHIEEATPEHDVVLERGHAAEHRELCDALFRLGSASDPGEGGRELERFCERLLAHLTWEEKAFLNAAVLRDEEPAERGR